MKKISTLFFAALTFAAFSPLISEVRDVTSDIPEIVLNSDFRKCPDVAQYKEGDWSQAVGIARNISLSEAFKIAKEDPEITFFFYTKGWEMVLEKTDETYRLFHQGDTVFFRGEPWWGSAPGLADGYIKQSNNDE